MKTLELLKTYGPVYFRPKGVNKWFIKWVKPGVNVRPPNMRNLNKLIDKGLAWDAHNRPACFGFITADELIGKSWHYAATYNKPKVPADALRENTKEMDLLARQVLRMIDELNELTDDREDYGNMFREDCLKALHSNNDAGIQELCKRMMANPLKDKTLKGLYYEWNEPRSPIRNFLLIRHIDFPESEIR